MPAVSCWPDEESTELNGEIPEVQIPEVANPRHQAQRIQPSGSRTSYQALFDRPGGQLSCGECCHASTSGTRMKQWIRLATPNRVCGVVCVVKIFCHAALFCPRASTTSKEMLQPRAGSPCHRKRKVKGSKHICSQIQTPAPASTHWLQSTASVPRPETFLPHHTDLVVSSMAL